MHQTGTTFLSLHALVTMCRRVSHSCGNPGCACAQCTRSISEPTAFTERFQRLVAVTGFRTIESQRMYVATTMRRAVGQHIRVPDAIHFNVGNSTAFELTFPPAFPLSPSPTPSRALIPHVGRLPCYYIRCRHRSCFVRVVVTSQRLRSTGRSSSVFDDLIGGNLTPVCSLESVACDLP